jgi:hypothetical protein
MWSHYLDNIVIWAPGNPPGIEEKVRKALASVDPDLVLYGVDSYDVPSRLFRKMAAGLPLLAKFQSRLTTNPKLLIL